MKRTIPKFHLLVSVCLATIALPALRAESRCPGSAASLPFRIVNRYQIIVDVSINHSGPYEFLLDTGTQISMGKVWGGHERNEMRTNEKPFVVPRGVSPEGRLLLQEPAAQVRTAFGHVGWLRFSLTVECPASRLQTGANIQGEVVAILMAETTTALRRTFRSSRSHRLRLG